MDKKIFGSYLAEKRQEKYLTLRELASIVDVSHTYLYNIENSFKAPPNDKLLLELSDALELSNKEKKIWFDISARTKQSIDSSNYHIPADIRMYLFDCKTACNAIRKVQELGLKDEFWSEFLKEIEKCVP